ncbi:hypothetical protein QBC38DRAFT_425849 [Podospora fimiseda]|uniref:Uncharacterized protein n=1 Tax=Podospora fimiseda TaxID=252190 RepID=A0AAN7BH36_9PEZI|nr:hypothetical protein QBC38DRAFT_425849 [Podospora fimiseda]
MSPVVECISQWKWNWFVQEHPIADFGVFDKASRGVLGSVFLVRLLKWKHVATVGAVISILGIVTTPVTQLLIQYPSHLVAVLPGPDTGNATSPAVQNYRSHVGLTGARSLDISSFVTSGLVHPSVTLISDVSPSCPSGTCTWPEFESLALCSKVANITDRIRVEQIPFSTSQDWTTWDDTLDPDPLKLNGTLAYNVSFPEEENESFVAPVSYTLYSSRLSRSIAFADDKALTAAWVAGYKVVWSNAGNVTYTHGNSTTSNPWRWQAFEMIYYACVNKYSVRVENGTAHTVALPSHAVITSSSDRVVPNCTTPRLVSGGAQKTTCNQEGRNSNQGVLALKGTLEASKGVNFTADIRSLTLLGQAITQDSSGIWAWDGGDFKVQVGNVATPTLADAVYGYKSAEADDSTKEPLGEWDVEIQRERLENVAKNLAVSITNGYGENAFPVLGTVFEMQVFVQVRWAWLTLLVVQLALALVFFVVTVIGTRRIGSQVYKSSALAALFALYPEREPEVIGRRAQMVEQRGAMMMMISSAGPPQQVMEKPGRK